MLAFVPPFSGIYIYIAQCLFDITYATFILCSEVKEMLDGTFRMGEQKDARGLMESMSQ